MGKILEYGFITMGKSTIIYTYSNTTDVILPGGEFPRDRLKYRLIYEYDSQGNLVAFYQSYSMGSDYVRKIVYKNNAKGNPRKTKAYYENGKRIKDPDIETTSRYKYEYYKKSEIKK